GGETLNFKLQTSRETPNSKLQALNLRIGILECWNVGIWSFPAYVVCSRARLRFLARDSSANRLLKAISFFCKTAFPTARIWIANKPAFLPPLMATVATGIPLGI